MLHKEFGLVSIIMAAYNAEKTIEQAIDSVLSQTYTNFELLVVNDCSKDRTAELVKGIAATDGRVRLISNVKNSVCLTHASMVWKKQTARGLRYLTVTMRGHRKSWKSRLSFKIERMPICFSQDLPLWMQMDTRLTGIFMHRQK